MVHVSCVVESAAFMCRRLDGDSAAHLKEFYGLSDQFPFHQLYIRTLGEEFGVPNTGGRFDWIC